MSYTEDHLVERPAIQLMQHELGWEVVNCYDDPTSLTILLRGFERQELRRTGWSGGVSNQGRDGMREGGNIEHRTPNIEHRSEERMKSRTKSAEQRLNPDLPVDHSSPRLRMAGAIEGAVEERGRGARHLATACGETPQPLSAERRLQFPPCGILVSRVFGFHENDNRYS
jgi:hypothetical protein